MRFKKCSVICLVCFIAIRAKQDLKISPKLRAEKHDTKIIDSSKASNITMKLIHEDKYFNKNINTKGISMEQLPLRIPPDLIDHVEEHRRSLIRTRRRADKELHVDFNDSLASTNGTGNPSQQLKRRGKQINPGIYSCGHQGSETFINFINPHYPGHDNVAGTCHFRILPNSQEICQVRIDFVDTELLTPTEGSCKDQYMSISGSIWPTGFGRVCGINPDQHFYVHISRAENFKHIDISITTVRINKSYKFGIWITQINCNEAIVGGIEAPGGCTQYHFGDEGVIKSFNFEGVQYLGNQNYKICIRASPGACFISITADPNHFMLQPQPKEEERRNFGFFGHSHRSRNRNTKNGRVPSGRGNEDCLLDYLLIPGARGNQTKYGPTVDRFCGGQLNSESDEDFSIPIYCEVTSNVVWMQMVTAIRDELAFSGTSSGNDDSDEDYKGTGQGIRLQFSQKMNCIERSYYGN